MKLKRYALIAEIVSATAVVLSLIYVAIEVRQNTRAQDAATYQEIYRDLRTVLTAVPNEMRLKIRAGEELSELEFMEYSLFVTLAMRGFENWWQQYQLGTINDEVFTAYISHMRIVLGDPVARDFWFNQTNLRRAQTIPGFDEFVDEFLANNPVTQ